MCVAQHRSLQSTHSLLQPLPYLPPLLPCCTDPVLAAVTGFGLADQAGLTPSPCWQTAFWLLPHPPCPILSPWGRSRQSPSPLWWHSTAAAAEEAIYHPDQSHTPLPSPPPVQHLTRQQMHPGHRTLHQCALCCGCHLDQTGKGHRLLVFFFLFATVACTNCIPTHDNEVTTA